MEKKEDNDGNSKKECVNEMDTQNGSIINWGKMHLQSFLSVLSSKEIGPGEVTAITMSLVFGSFVIVLPYTVNLVGLPIWITVFIVVILLVSYSNHLMNESCLRMLEEYKGEKFVRAPQMKIAKLAGGNAFQKLVVGALYTNFAFFATSLILVASTVLGEIVSIPGISEINSVRFWVVISTVCIFPLVQLGFYKDLKQSAFIALTTSYLALLVILCTSAYILLKGKIPAESDSKYIHPNPGNVFRVFGTVFYAVGGITVTTPEIIVFAKEPRKMDQSIFVAYTMLTVSYMGYSIIMYGVFQGCMKPTTTATLLQAIELNANAAVPRTCIFIVQLGISLHFMLAAVLFLNPFFTNIESNLKIPVEFTWKRFVLRACGLLAVATVCLLLPNFQSVVSLMGGTVLVLSSTILPIIMYARLHELTTCKKIFLFFACLFAAVCMVGNFVVSTRDIVNGVASS